MERKDYFLRKQNRIENYNYFQNGYYFVTVCTQNHVPYFGEISDEKMILNECGEIVFEVLKNVPNFYKNIYLDEFIIMPNHLHMILVIKSDNNVVTEHCSVQSGVEPTFCMTAQCAVTTNKTVNLSQIINSFKGVCTKKIRKELQITNFQWQRSFYDHVIRNEKSLQNIRKYIVNNPAKWQLDKYFNEL